MPTFIQLTEPSNIHYCM